MDAVNSESYANEHTGSFPHGMQSIIRCSHITNKIVQIPKPNVEEGLTVGWPQQKTDMDKLKELVAEIKAKM